MPRTFSLVRATALVVAGALCLLEAGWPGALLVAAALPLLAPVRVPRLLGTAAAVIALAAVAIATPAAALLLPVIIPETFWRSGFRQAVIPVTVDFAIATAAIIGHGVQPAGWAFMPLAAGYVLSLFAAAWVSQLVAAHDKLEQALAQLRASRAELTRAHQEAGAQAERERINREVHDGVAQRLLAVRMLLESARHKHAEGRTEDVAQRCEMAYEQALAGMLELRQLLGSRGPDDSATESSTDELRATVENTVAAVMASSDIEVAVSFDGDDLDSLVALGHRPVLVRFIHEAVNNAVRHSGANHVSVRVAHDDSAVSIAVEDDGIGPGVAAPHTNAPGHGYGLASLACRLDAIGGSLRAGRGRAGGFLVTATVPNDAQLARRAKESGRAGDVPMHHGPAVSDVRGGEVL